MPQRVAQSQCRPAMRRAAVPVVRWTCAAAMCVWSPWAAMCVWLLELALQAAMSCWAVAMPVAGLLSAAAGARWALAVMYRLPLRLLLPVATCWLDLELLQVGRPAR